MPSLRSDRSIAIAAGARAGARLGRLRALPALSAACSKPSTTPALMSGTQAAKKL